MSGKKKITHAENNHSKYEYENNNSKNRKYDSAWKKVIRELLENFMEFFFPEIHAAIDFTKPVAFLDKELKEIDPDSELGDRVADMLVKVHLKNGETQYIFIVIHIEIQGKEQDNFMDRMFIYHYRIVDKERKEKIPVISVAILTDENPKFRKDLYEFELFGFELRMKIPIVKITDYKYNDELKKKLETSTNPMSMIVKAQLKSHEVKNVDDDKKFEVTKELIRQCYRYGYSKEKTHIVLNFFDWVIRLPETYKESIKRVIKQAEEEKKMEYVAIWERDKLNEGLVKGKKLGRKEGAINATLRIAKSMLNAGIATEIILEHTGISAKKLNELKASLKNH